MNNRRKLENFLSHINCPEIAAISRVQNVLLKELQLFAFHRNFKQLMPLLVSPITDPLNHQVCPAELNYAGKKLKLTASMIFHKQLALIPREMDKILIMAPNIRLELESEKRSNNHLIEFSQYDIEVKDASVEDIMDFIEDLYIHIFNQINLQCREELTLLGRKLPPLIKPFLKYSTVNIPYSEIESFCATISNENTQPVFVSSFKREFYDKEDDNNPGMYCNFDLIYPQEYGEALSGAEREHEYDRIVRRMDELAMDKRPFENYLEVAKKGLLPRTAGAGIGIQRLLKFICGKEAIKDVCIFDRSLNSDFVF